MSHRKLLSLFVIGAVSAVSLFTLSHCGSDNGGTGLEDISLANVPSASTMLAGTGTYGLSKPEIPGKSGINLQSVSGTPPYLVNLTNTNALTYFWNGVVTTINNASSCSASNRNKFWGQDTSTPGGGGHGACMMAQGTGEALSRMLDGTSTLCYMKGIQTASNGVTISSGTASQAFKPSEGDKVVKVQVTNFSQYNGRPTMDVFFRIYGTNSVGNKYRYKMWMCQQSSIVNIETLDLNKADGTISVESYNNESGNSRGYMNISAYLKNENGSIKFDPSKNRSAISKFTGSWGSYVGSVSLESGDIIKSKRYNSNATWGTNRSYTVAAFAGSSVDDFRFLQGCVKGQSIPANNSTTWSYGAITEYRDTYYAAVSSSDLSPQCDSYAFGSDSFFSDVSIPSMDTTGVSCTDSPDITITMDFSASSIVDLKNTCDGDRRKLQNYAMCDSNAVRTAEGYCRQ